MNWFRQLPLAQKLTLQALAISAVAILLIGLTSIAYEHITFRQTVVTELEVQTQIIGANCAAALEFENPATARETLSSLQARADIVDACIYGLDGKLFAEYRSANATAPFPPPQPAGTVFERGELVLFRPIHRNEEPLGTVVLRADLRPHYQQLTRRTFVAVVAILCAAVIATALAMRLQRVIARPILELADLAERIRIEHDYSLRAQKRGGDEVGLLTEGINRMLEGIQRRDAELHQANDALQQSEQRFRQLAESIHEVFWMVDPTHGNILYASPAYEQLWGRSCASLYQDPRSWLAAVHPEDRPRVQAALPLQAHGGYDLEYRITRPDGSLRWIRDRAFPIRDTHGQVYRLAGIAEDITEKHQHQESLRRLSIQVLRAQDEERRRIASELHDVTVQHLIGTGFALSSLRNSPGLSPAQRQTLDDTVQSLKDCATEPTVRCEQP